MLRALAGQVYWIEGDELRLTADDAAPNGVTTWAYDRVTASRRAFAAFLIEARVAGLGDATCDAIRREQHFGLFLP